MKPAPPQWRPSPAMGAVMARLVELYARALRVDAARKAQRMEKFARLVEEVREK